MDAGTMDSEGRSSTNGGKICGIIATVLWGLSALILIGTLVSMFVVAGR